jgi:serine/threonine-protein kinase
VGVSLYELVTGKRPFEGDSQFSIMAAHLKKTPAPPTSLNPSLPAALNDVIQRSLAKAPAKRFQTAEEFRQALRGVLPATSATTPITAFGTTAPRKEFGLTQPSVPEVRRSYRSLWMAAGAIAAVLTIVIVVQVGPWKSTRASQAPAAVKPAVVTPVSPEPVPTKPAPTTPEPAGRTPAPAPEAPRRAEPRVTPVPPPAAPPANPSPAPLTPPPDREPLPPPPTPREDPARRAELQQIREQLAMLSARAGACNDGLKSLTQSQGAVGLGLRSDIAGAANLMNTFIQGANNALDAGDAPKAKDLMEKAESQVERIEKFLGR